MPLRGYHQKNWKIGRKFSRDTILMISTESTDSEFESQHRLFFFYILYQMEYQKINFSNVIPISVLIFLSLTGGAGLGRTRIARNNNYIIWW